MFRQIQEGEVLYWSPTLDIMYITQNFEIAYYTNTFKYLMKKIRNKMDKIEKFKCSKRCSVFVVETKNFPD